MSRIAYLGPQGTFTEQATRILVGDDEAKLLPMSSVSAALEAVRSSEAVAAGVPVENSVEGSVTATLDSLAVGEPLVTVAETLLPIRFSVLGRPGVSLAGVRTITTHPHAEAQVQGWLAQNVPHAEMIPAASTAAAALAVANGEADAAVSAPLAGEHYGLSELATDVADVADAVTRFLFVRRPGQIPSPTGADRTSIAAVISDDVGSLADLLSEFSLRGINLNRIESRPTRSAAGPYRFFLDLDGHIAERRVGDALTALRRRCAELRFLGSYPKGDQRQTSVPGFTSDHAFVRAEQWLDGVRSGEFA